MYAIFSAQNMHTLRCCRLGPRPPGPLDSERLTAICYASLKGNFVGIDVTRRVVRSRDVVVSSFGARGAVTGSTRLEKLHVVGDDLGGPPLLAVLAFPRSGLDAPFDEDERTLSRVLGHDLGQVSLADVVRDDVVVIGELFALTLSTA